MVFHSSASTYLLFLPRTLPPQFFSSDPNPCSLFRLISSDTSSREPLLTPSDGGLLHGSHSLSHSSAEGCDPRALT